MKPLRFFVVFCAVGTLLSGCGGGSSSNKTPAQTADVPATTRSQYGPLEFTLTTPKTKFKQGEDAVFVFTVKNISTSTVVLNTDVDPINPKVTQNGRSIFFGQGGRIGILQATTLASGQKVTYQTGWAQRDSADAIVPRGDYEFSARLSASEIKEGDKVAISYTLDERNNFLGPPLIKITLQ